MTPTNTTLEWAALVTAGGTSYIEPAPSDAGAMNLVDRLNAAVEGTAELAYRTRTPIGDPVDVDQVKPGRPGSASRHLDAAAAVGGAGLAALDDALVALDFDVDLEAIAADVEPVDALHAGASDVEWLVRYTWPDGHTEDREADDRLQADEDVVAHNRPGNPHTSTARTMGQPIALSPWRTFADNQAVDA